MTTMAEDLIAIGIKDPINSAARAAIWDFLCNQVHPKHILEARRKIFKESEEKFVGKKIYRIKEPHIRGLVQYIRPKRDSRAALPNSTFEAQILWNTGRTSLILLELIRPVEETQSP